MRFVMLLSVAMATLFIQSDAQINPDTFVGPPILTAPKTQFSKPTSVTVYGTTHGKMYHRADCKYLAKSSHPLPLSEAATRYGACSICNPPRLGVAAESTPTAKKSPKASEAREVPSPAKRPSTRRKANAGW